MASWDTSFGRSGDSYSSFAIHTDQNDAQAHEWKVNSAARPALLLGSSNISNNQRESSLDANDKHLPKSLSESRSSNLDKEAHKSLLKALEEHCNMVSRRPYAESSERFDEDEDCRFATQPKKKDAKDNSDLKEAWRPTEYSRVVGAPLVARDSRKKPDEVEQLKLELEAAKQKIATQEQELTIARLPSSSALQPSIEQDKADDTMDHTLFGLCNDLASFDLAEPARQHGVAVLGGNAGGHAGGQLHALPIQGFLDGNNYAYNLNSTSFPHTTAVWNEPIGRTWSGRYAAAAFPNVEHPPQHLFGSREFAVSRPASPVTVSKRHTFNEYDFGATNAPRKTSGQLSKWTTAQLSDSRLETWDTSAANEPYSSMNYNDVFPSTGLYQQGAALGSRAIGTVLSPTAHEFTANGAIGPWNNTHVGSSQTYVSTTEPLNYRRLLDRSVSCNWKYIVDKIVCNNDQQASIFLQQKLKIGTVEQKFEIVEAIVAQAYPLMVNRFGNFLVQRCFEHGTPEQVIAIANAIRGNTLNLSMDAFGCHVVQKAFDAVPEEYKAVMVHELLRRIPETVIHRYACHVWQKLFELRWSDSPPQIMKHVNEALREMWHEVALGETGSLVVQNIFENCLEEDKRPCINEVLKSIDIIAHGQFGNWCIQHICEHGAPADRSKAIDHVLCYASEYSMDQFASKVVEKCLKIGGSDFLERYLDRVCEGLPDRPRIPLIDIASDQYGNYLIQYILTHANGNHREIVASHIRKHMVSLRGSKFGSRVGMLCSNPAYATRPGPGVGPSTSRYSVTSQMPRFQGQYR